MSRVLYMAVLIGFICAVGAFLLNGMHLHTVLNPNERFLFTASALFFGALIGAIAGATSAIIEAIRQQKKSNERTQP